MKVKSVYSVLILIFLPSFNFAQSAKKGQKDKTSNVAFVKKEAEKKIDVLIEGKLFTTYCWYDNVTKPVLYPVFTSSGTEITRAFPLKPKAGERNDHPHQIGMWLTYGNVNGTDFWGNGSSGLGTKNANGGIIRHVRIENLSENKGLLSTSESWADSTGKELLSEHSSYYFLSKGSVRIIDRITVLTAIGKTVTFKDTKEGMFGIRVARQLELPLKENVTLTDAQGNPAKVKTTSIEGVTGNYRSSEGVTGEAVWSTRARWMDLYGSIGNEKISVVICDHPKNQSYPTFWHARGYGLFSANPLGSKDFTQGKEELNYSLPAGKSTTFRYRLIVNSGTHLTDAEINAYADDFAKKY